MRKLLKKQGVTPATIVTDKLGSYSSALRELGVARRHDTGRWSCLRNMRHISFGSLVAETHYINGRTSIRLLERRRRSIRASVTSCECSKNSWTTYH